MTSAPEQNRVVRQTAFGGPENISIVIEPVPRPGPGEALVRVHAAGLNPVDWKIAAYPPPPPVAEAFDVTVPGGYGNDLAGVVAAVGDGVTDLRVGDRVVGGARGQAVADYTLVPAANLTRVPEGLTLAQASTLPIAARTAEAAIGLLALGPEDAVLIGGAAGGVGVFATQLAVRTGALVIATASADNHGFLRELGAVPVEYGDGLADRIRTVLDGRELTAAADLQGSATARAALELGVPAVRITTVANNNDPIDGVIVTGAQDAPADTIPRTLDDIAAGRLRVVIAEEYPIERTADAVTRLRQGHVRGKLLIMTTA